MANLLTMAIIETIYTLHQRGWSQRRIARELGVNRETVARYIARTQTAKPANAPIGSEAESEKIPWEGKRPSRDPRELLNSKPARAEL